MDLTSTEKRIIEKLIKKYGNDVTLGTLLSMKPETNVEDIVFELEGYYDNAYECTGDEFTISGTIKSIFRHEWNCTCNENGVTLNSILSDEQLDELTDFFFGDRDEEYCIYTNDEQSTFVTKEEVRKYLETLKVDSRFDYDDTIIEF